MEQVRFFLAIVLCLLVFIVWDYFFIERSEIPVDQTQTTDNYLPVPGDKVATPYPPTDTPSIPEPFAAADIETVSSEPARIITIETPLYMVRISEKGAVFTSYTLKKYREKVESDAPLKELIPPGLPNGTVHFGLANKSIPGIANAVFKTTLHSDTNVVGAMTETQTLTFSWTSPHGIRIDKVFVFTPETYLIGFNITLTNTSGRPIQDKLFLTMMNIIPENARMIGFVGPCAYINQRLEQIDLSDIKEKDTYSGRFEWLAVQDRYFMSALIPETDQDNDSIHLTFRKDLLESRFIHSFDSLEPDTRRTFKFTLFFGPKSLETLKSLEHNLDKSIHFGMFDFLAKICLWMMNYLYKFIPNFGVAIIILTIFIKILCWPLGNKSYKSMNEMKKLQPLMTGIRERYKDDKQKMNAEVMNLYKTYKINPLSGCLPMLVQMPVLFALYRMLYEAIELRHAPFMFWMNDLSAPDRLFHFNFAIPFMEEPSGIPVLTLIMGVTMLLQQKMAPPAGDPVQAKMMMIMPVVFTFIFINFSSGLVLYWLVNNILSIAQQYYITKKFA